MPARILEAPPPPRPASKRKPMTPNVSASLGTMHGSSEQEPQTQTPWRTVDYESEGETMHMTPIAGTPSFDDDENDENVMNDENAMNDENDVHNSQPSGRKVSFSHDTVFKGASSESEEGVYIGSDDDAESSDDEDDLRERPVIHVEVRIHHDSLVIHDTMVSLVSSFLRRQYKHLRAGFEVPEALWSDIVTIGSEVDRILVTETGDDDQSVSLAEADLVVHVYRITSEGATELAVLEAGGIEDRDRQQDDEVKTSPALVHSLPCAEFESLWDNLIYDDNIKPRLLRYISSSMLFSESEVDYNVISWNRMVLLHGPPGTGKTSLCRALAQKLAIRTSHTFSRGTLVEINSHSLFSKWFSESGKLVQKLFDTVHDLIADESQLVIVMIDEVESLTSSREGSGEPGDALRVVNALLTQLDKLKQHKNVLVMTTSNLAGKIDPAFLDRADLKQYVGLPPANAIYWMIQSSLAELGRAGLAVGHDHLLPWAQVGTAADRPVASKRGERGRLASIALMKLAQKCHKLGFSGRFLRRVPLMAHAKYLRGPARIDRWVAALDKAVDDEHASRELLGSKENGSA